MAKTRAELEKLAAEIYKKTFAYEMDRVQVNDDGTTTHLHSDAFLDKHPERRDSPEFTEEEEIEQANFIAGMAMEMHRQFPHSLFPKRPNETNKQ